MIDSKSLVAIPRKQRLLHEIGLFPNLGGRCYVVFSDNYFGWRPSIAPWNLFLFFPERYFVIPVTAIKSAEFKGNWMEVSVQFVTSLTDPALQVVEGQIQLPYLWLRALDTLGIPVVNREAATLTTVKGFLWNYGGVVWVFAILIVVAIALLISFRMGASAFVLWLILFSVVPFAIFVTFIARAFLKMRAARRDADDNPTSLHF